MTARPRQMRARAFSKGHPDTILVNPLHIKYLRKNDDFYLDFDSSRNYYGRINYLDIYFCSGIKADEYMVYEKRNTELYMTPLKVKFLKFLPEILEISETYVAWNHVPDSLVVYKL